MTRQSRFPPNGHTLSCSDEINRGGGAFICRREGKGEKGKCPYTYIVLFSLKWHKVDLITGFW